MKIYIDAGHGGADSGAVGNGLKEKDLTLKIALKIKNLLEKYECEVRLSRETDKTLSLDQRTNDANKWGADFLLSIHINAGGGVGYEDYIFNKLSDSSKTAILRNIIHAEIMSDLPFKNRGKKKANFHMLRESEMPAMLSENGFIDSKLDADKLKNNSFINMIALAHVNGLVKAFNLKQKKVVEKPVKEGTMYRVVTGSFEDRANAEKRVTELERKGFDSFIDIVEK